MTGPALGHPPGWEHSTRRVCSPSPQLLSQGPQSPMLQPHPSDELQGSVLFGRVEPQSSALRADGQRTSRLRVPLPQELEQLDHWPKTQEQPTVSAQLRSASGRGNPAQSPSSPLGQTTARVEVPRPQV